MLSQLLICRCKESYFPLPLHLFCLFSSTTCSKQRFDLKFRNQGELKKSGKSVLLFPSMKKIDARVNEINRSKRAQQINNQLSLLVFSSCNKTALTCKNILITFFILFPQNSGYFCLRNEFVKYSVCAF